MYRRNAHIKDYIWQSTANIILAEERLNLFLLRSGTSQKHWYSFLLLLAWYRESQLEQLGKTKKKHANRKTGNQNLPIYRWHNSRYNWSLNTMDLNWMDSFSGEFVFEICNNLKKSRWAKQTWVLKKEKFKYGMSEKVHGDKSFII